MPDNKLWIYKKPENEADGMPTAIQELVLCKNCRFFTEPDSQGDQCAKIHWSRGADWFCADGRRVDNNA